MFISLVVIAILLPIIFIIQDIIIHKLVEGKQQIEEGQRKLNAGTVRYNQGLRKYNKYNNWFVQTFAARKLESGRRQLEDGRQRLEQGRRELEAGKRKWNLWNCIRYVLIGLCVLSFIFLIASLGYKFFGSFGWLGLLVFVVLTLLWSLFFFWITKKLSIVSKGIWVFFWYCIYFIPLILF